MNWQQQCFEIWGERWKSTLALTSRRLKRQIQRWNAGTTPIPQDVITKIDATYKIWVIEQEEDICEQLAKGDL